MTIFAQSQAYNMPLKHINRSKRKLQNQKQIGNQF